LRVTGICPGGVKAEFFLELHLVHEMATGWQTDPVKAKK
jgi:hypothetical protein